jgi:hypothetical protein
MAATMERLEEYRTHNLQFCKRLYEYSCIMFTAQVRPNQLHAHLVMKPKGCPPVNDAIRRFEWTVEAQRTRQIGNQEPQGPREPPGSLQWTNPVYEGDG